MEKVTSKDTASGADGQEILFGVHPIQEALASGKRLIHKLYLLRGRNDKPVQAILKSAKDQGVAIYFESRDVLDRLAGSTRHQGVLGFLGAASYATLEKLLQMAQDRSEPPFLILLDGVEDPRNLGAIIRTAEAVGAHGLVIPQRRAAGVTAAAARAAAGAEEFLPVAQVVNLTQTIQDLKTRGLWIYGLDEKAKQVYHQTDLRGPLALIIGGEGKGIRRLVLEHCDALISIPMVGRVESLNVSVAAAIVLYEVLRQRRK
ncbi:MAG TPA: 23S rRNA (guanosine(2251)-2'-O)-methyltransferase RlmB [Nitrospiria bacterium]|jgi:23S rRNA (guanosine2251-2'-O)-methyltransferase|nr:23S rRNA (guanosine(2251)-2'-O)-methyltransferase RlmB [Nitrospiria bacterium]